MSISTVNCAPFALPFATLIALHGVLDLKDEHGPVKEWKQATCTLSRVVSPRRLLPEGDADPQGIHPAMAMRGL